MKNLSSNDKKCVYGIILSCVIMVFGILFLVNAMGVANFYKSYAAIKNPLAKYLVVILVMAPCSSRVHDRAGQRGGRKSVGTFGLRQHYGRTYHLRRL